MNREPTGKVIRDYGLTVGVAVVIALLIRVFIVEAYRIPTPVMRPTLEPGDTIFVSKIRYNLSLPWSSTPAPHGPAPRRGEVVLFSPPSDANRDYIKRIVGVAGDSIQLRHGRLVVNGKSLAYDLARADAPCGAERWPDGTHYQVCWEQPLIDDYGPEKVPAGSVFVLGDLRSRTATEFSKIRSWGVIPESALKGKALWIWMSIEPRTYAPGSDWFPRFRFPRMFRRIE